MDDDIRLVDVAATVETKLRSRVDHDPGRNLPARERVEALHDRTDARHKPHATRADYDQLPEHLLAIRQYLVLVELVCGDDEDLSVRNDEGCPRAIWQHPL